MTPWPPSCGPPTTSPTAEGLCHEGSTAFPFRRTCRSYAAPQFEAVSAIGGRLSSIQANAPAF